jgi:hypothetical protein
MEILHPLPLRNGRQTSTITHLRKKRRRTAEMLVQALARAGMRSENYGMKSGTWIKMANKGGSDGHKLRLRAISISGARDRRMKDM